MLAVKTLAAIEEALVRDQGAAYRGHLGTLMPLAGDAYSTKEEAFRNHLGASLLGRKCARELWYSYRWVTRKAFSGDMLRLFNRGHLEEPRFLALFKTIGCEIWQHGSDGRQFRAKWHRNHAGGSLDSVIRGIPDLPDEPVLGEFKTHGEKSFAKLKANGVLDAKWEHFIQMQIYMHFMGLKWAIYCAVNKNTDELYFELVRYDEGQALKYINRAGLIIDSPIPLPKISTSPGWYECQFCDHKGVCHGKVQPERNCRTCIHSRPGDNGVWLCESPDMRAAADAQGWDDLIELDQEAQLKGCEYYELNPAIKA